MQEFTNNTIDLDNLPQYQETKLTAPHANYWKVILINLSIFILITAGGLTAFIFLNEEITIEAPYMIAGYAVFIILLFIIYRISFKKRGFALREKDIIYKHGIIAETTVIIPLNRIQHVALDESLFARMFGLATLQVFTAGGQTGHMNIAGIEVEKAKIIKEVLVKRLDLLETSTDN